MINLKNCKIFYDPYPHALFQNVFDSKFYNSLCDEFPREIKFDRFDFDKQNNLKQKKFVLNDDSNLFNSIIKKKPNLKKLYNFLSSEQFQNIIFEILEQNSIKLQKSYEKSLLKQMYNKFKNKKKFGFEFSMISTDGGFIKPHTDGADKLISFVMPIIENDNISKIPNSGTNILKTNNDNYKYNLLNSTVPFEVTEVVREIPFDKNQIFLFVKTHNSLHSVGPMKDLNEKNLMRKSINFFIYK